MKIEKNYYHYKINLKIKYFNLNINLKNSFLDF
jgi:hypothetical protein